MKRTKGKSSTKKEGEKKQFKTTATQKIKTKKAKTTSPRRILAVAIGDPNNSRPIKDISSLTIGPVRPYIGGMIAYLDGQGLKLDTHYIIDYQECYEGGEDFTATPTPALVLCMSTPLVKAASDFTNDPSNQSTFVVGVASDPANSNFGNNVCGVNAQRIQNATKYYNHFRNFLGHNKTITLLNRTNNIASELCKKAIENAHGGTVPVQEVDPPPNANPTSHLIGAVENVNTAGLLVLPVDLFFGWYNTINTAAADNQLSIFWPAEEFARHGDDHFGAPQVECGRKLGEQVQYIFSNNAIPTGAQRWKKVNPR
jgi:hypothetical protein